VEIINHKNHARATTSNKIYGFFQKMVYFTVVMDCCMLFFLHANIKFLSNLLANFSKMVFFYPPLHAKLATIVLIALVATELRQRKKDLNITKEIIIPIIIGLGMILGSLALVNNADNNSLSKVLPGLNLFQIIYALLSLVGAIITQVGADNISKYMQLKMGKDRWNVEEESFDQNQELVETYTSVNIPYIFRHNKKNNNGWINVNPFSWNNSHWSTRIW
jgi:hypothetical protein